MPTTSGLGCLKSWLGGVADQTLSCGPHVLGCSGGEVRFGRQRPHRERLMNKMQGSRWQHRPWQPQESCSVPLVHALPVGWTGGGQPAAGGEAAMALQGVMGSGQGRGWEVAGRYRCALK